MLTTGCCPLKRTAMCGPYAYVFKKYENLNVIQNFFDSNPPPSSVYIKTCAGGGGLYCKSVFMNNRSKPGFCLKPLNHEKL